MSEVRHIRNYYLLVIMMGGVIDDFQEALNELMRAANLPVSVLIVKIGGSQDENDTKNLMELSQKAFDKAER